MLEYPMSRSKPRFGQHPGFIVEFNQPLVYAGQGLAESIERGGRFSARRLRHVTAWHVKYGANRTRNDLETHLRTLLNSTKPSEASALVVSKLLGKHAIIRVRQLKAKWR